MKTFKSLFSKLVFVFAVYGLSASGEDWPQYRGAKGDAVSSEDVGGAWPFQGLKLRWRVAMPGGFSSFAVAAGKAITVVAREMEGQRQEVCVALNCDDGKEIWATPTGLAKYQGGADSGAPGNQGGDGPRSTPTWNDGRVYVYSVDMILSCLDGTTGALKWKKDIGKEFGGRPISWQSAASPVVEGQAVLVQGGGAGQSLIAFDRTNGEVLWKTGDEMATHATPLVVTLHEVRQVIFFTQTGLTSRELATGKELWRFSFPFRTSTACLPVVGGDIVFCTAGYDIGAAACRITKGPGGLEAKEIWRSKGNNPAASLWSPPVYKDGCLYGLISFKKFASGPLKCLDLATGELKWQQEGFGAGNVALAGNHLVCLSDDGRLVLVEANPNKYQELAQFKAIDGKCWSSPAISNGRIYVRSTKEGACYEFKTQ